MSTPTSSSDLPHHGGFPDGIDAPDSFELLSATDGRLAASTDPARSRRRIVTAGRLGDERPSDAQEVFKGRILAELDRHGAALSERTTAPGHLTGSAVVIDAVHERALVMLHTKLRRWLQPGGHADGDHELAAVALREASEETGIEGLAVLVPAIDLDIHEVDHAGVAGDGTQRFLHLDVRFIVLAPPGAVRHANHESLDTAWVSLDELSALTDEPSVTRVIRRALAALAVTSIRSAAGSAPDDPLGAGWAPDVRPWQPGDLGFLWQMLHEALHVRSGHAAPARTVLAERGIARYLTGFGDLTDDDALVALGDEGELIGAVWCRRSTADDPSYGYVDDDTPEMGMSVVASWRNCGVGTALLAAMQDRHPRLSLSVDPDNDGAVRLYERAGFVTVTQPLVPTSEGEHPTLLWTR